MLCRQANCPALMARLPGAFSAMFCCLVLAGCGGGGGPDLAAAAPVQPAAVVAAAQESCRGPACAGGGYWDALAGHAYLQSAASPHQRAFAAFGIEHASANRSGNSYLLDGGAHGREIVDLLGRIGLTADRYTYLQMQHHDAEKFSVAEVTANYLGMSSADLVNFSFGFVYATDSDRRRSRIQSGQIKDGAWIIHSTGNGSSQDPFASLSEADRQGALAAAATGKVHFYYGLNAQLTGRHSSSNGCRNIAQHCIGAPYQFTVQSGTGQLLSLRGTSYSAPFGFATYLLTWERLPADTDIAAVFALAEACVEDIGAAGADADTGLGRLDIGCMADAASRTQQPSATMDDFAQDLLGSRLGELTLPGATDAGIRVGFAGDSFAGIYRPASATSAYQSSFNPDLRQLALAPSFGIIGAADGRLGAYWQVAERLQAQFSLAAGKDFFGGRGHGEFGFSCSRNASLALAGASQNGALRVQGWLQESRAGCISGALLDDLRGREAGLSVGYQRRFKDVRISARMWGSRFLGGRLSVAGERSAIAAGAVDYGGGIRLSYSF